MHGSPDECECKADGEGRKKLRETVEWYNEYANQCEGCRDIYGEKNEEPPCYTCKPEFIEENAEAIEIFYLIRNQFVMSMNGPIDIMHEPIYRAMDMFSIIDRKKCFFKVLSMAHVSLSKMRDKS